MKGNLKFHRGVILLGMAFVLIVGFSFPSVPLRTAFADRDDGDSGDSGGFTIHADKVNGEMDLLKALAGKIDIKEGKIYGLTITKELKTGTDKGPLVIKIKTPPDKAIPVEKLKAKTKGGGLPDFGGLCAPEKLGWLCLSDVTMTVTEQTADAIELPDATVKTCFKDQCEEDEKGHEESANTAKTSYLNQNKSLGDIKKDISGFKEQIKKVQKLIKEAQEKQTSISDEDQAAKLRQLIDDAQKALDQPDKLVELANKIDDQYSQLNGDASHLALKIANADDILKQISNQVDQDKKRLKKLAKEKEKKETKADEKGRPGGSKTGASVEDLQKQLDKKKKQNDDKKQDDKKKSTDDKNKAKDNKSKDAKPEVNIKDLEKQLSKVKEKMEDPSDQVDKLTETVLKGDKRDSLTGQLKDFYGDIGQLSDKIKGFKDNDPKNQIEKGAEDNESKDSEGNGSGGNDSGDEAETIRESLDVAKPGRMIGKQISDMQKQIDKKMKEKEDLLDDTKEHADQLQKQLDQANKTVEKSKLPVKVAKKVGKQKEEIKQALKNVNKKSNDIRDQLKGPIEKLKNQVDMNLDDLRDRVQMPEDMARKYKNQPLPQKEINDYRAEMKDHLKEWQKQRKQIKKGMDNHDQLDQVKEQQSKILQSIDDLRVTVKENRGQYSEKPFQTIVENLQTVNASEDQVKDEEKKPSPSSNDKTKDKSSDDKTDKDGQSDTKDKNKTDHSAVIQSIKRSLAKANPKVEDLEKRSNDLANKILVINTLDKKKADDFRSHLKNLKGDINDLEQPVNRLKKDISEGKNGNSNHDLQEEKKVIKQVTALKSNLKDIKGILGDLPSFTRIDGPEGFTSKIESMITKIDTRTK